MRTAYDTIHRTVSLLDDGDAAHLIQRKDNSLTIHLLGAGRRQPEEKGPFDCVAVLSLSLPAAEQLAKAILAECKKPEAVA